MTAPPFSRLYLLHPPDRLHRFKQRPYQRQQVAVPSFAVAVQKQHQIGHSMKDGWFNMYLVVRNYSHA